jgi:hypothetical protein
MLCRDLYSECLAACDALLNIEHPLVYRLFARFRAVRTLLEVPAEVALPLQARGAHSAATCMLSIICRQELSLSGPVTDLLRITSFDGVLSRCSLGTSPAHSSSAPVLHGAPVAPPRTAVPSTSSGCSCRGRRADIGCVSGGRGGDQWAAAQKSCCS